MLTLTDFMEALPAEAFDWWRLLEAYASVFGEANLIVRAFDRDVLTDRGGLLEDFSTLIDGCPSLISLREQHNVGLSPDSIEVLRRSNSALSEEGRLGLVHALRAWDRERLPPAEMTPPGTRIADFMNESIASNRLVAEKYLGAEGSSLIKAAKAPRVAQGRDHVADVVPELVAWLADSSALEAFDASHPSSSPGRSAVIQWLERHPSLDRAVRAITGRQRV